MELPSDLITDGTLQEDLPVEFGSVIPGLNLPKPVNFADHEATKNLIQSELLPLLRQVRDDRASLNAEWDAIRRMELMHHDDGQRYMGRSNAYVPVFNRNSATLVSALSRGLFPSDDYIDVTTLSGRDMERAKDAKTYLQWEFEKVGQVRRYLKGFLKALVNYGNAPLKFTYRKSGKYQGRLKRAGNILTGGFSPVVDMDGLQVSARPVQNVYVFPHTAESLAEASLIFEDINVSKAAIEAKLRSGEWKNAEEALNATRPSELDLAELEMAAARNISATVPYVGEGIGNIRAITEVWTFLKLPRQAYVDGEDPECLLPVLIILAGNCPVFVGRNPFWHQMPPYLWARTNTEPGHFYGYGSGKVVRGLQYLTNDYANQMNDVGTYSLNPVALVNPALLAGPLKPLKPGGTISVTDVGQAIKWDRPPVELIQYGAQMMSIWSGMSQDFGGAPPILQGQAAGKTGKTATGAQILQRNAMMPLQDVVEDIELDVMIPLLKGTWLNAQQFRTEEIQIAVSGKSLKVDPQLLSLDTEFRWLGSSQAVNQQMRAQQAISLLQAIGPIVPLAMQQGYVVDPVPLIRRIYTDGFGFRGFDDFIHKMTQDPAAAMGMMAQAGAIQPAQNPGMPGAEQGDRIRSALEQIPGGGGEMVPGEGEDFAAVRQQADQMAGDAGSQGGNF